MNIVGCDPGAFGAIAVLNTETRQLTLIDMPTIKVKRGPRVVNQVDPALLAQALRPHIRENDQAYVEKTWAMTGQGVSSSFAFGRAGGVLEGVLATLGATVTLVPLRLGQKQCVFLKGKTPVENVLLNYSQNTLLCFLERKMTDAPTRP